MKCGGGFVRIVKSRKGLVKGSAKASTGGLKYMTYRQMVNQFRGCADKREWPEKVDEFCRTGHIINEMKEVGIKGPIE